jgi:hypothetical protein
MRNRFLAFASLASTVTLAACNGPTLDASSASKALSVASGASNQIQAMITPQVMAGQGAWITGTQAAFTLSGTVSNPNGTGTATVSGNGSSSSAGSQLTFTMALSNWHDNASNITMDGSLKADFSMTTGTPSTMSMHETGDLDASGAVNGMVDFDLTLKSSGSSSTVCGHVGGQTVGTGGC